MKIRITEEEKLNIVSLHNENYFVNKKVISEQFNPDNGTYVVQNDQGLKAVGDQNVVYPKTIKRGTVIFHDYSKQGSKIVLGSTGVVTYCNKNVFIYNDAIDNLKNDPFLNVIKTVFCNGNTLKTWKELTKGKTEERKDTDKSKGSDCKNKNPYNALTDGGLNWKQERQKWIDAKCNGTTPCILGNAQTNINLRNAFCEGKWPMKTDGQQTIDCQTKCSARPLKAGQVGPQVQMWFNSDDNVCFEGTGSGGFNSKQECEACNCKSLISTSNVQQTNTETTATTATQPTNIANNVASTLKQFPNLTFGVRTK